MLHAPALTNPNLFSSPGMITVPAKPVTTQIPRIPAMNASENDRSALRYDSMIPSNESVVR